MTHRLLCAASPDQPILLGAYEVFGEIYLYSDVFTKCRVADCPYIYGQQ